MYENIDEPDYADAVRQLMAESDAQAFLHARDFVKGLRNTYIMTYDYVIKNWARMERLDRVNSSPSSAMHG